LSVSKYHAGSMRRSTEAFPIFPSSLFEMHKDGVAKPIACCQKSTDPTANGLLESKYLKGSG
jgi:hypothetical protein